VTLTLRPMLRQLQDCLVCRQWRDQEAAHETAVTRRLCGEIAWAICPSCQQQAPDPDDLAYRYRARRFRQRTAARLTLQ
jgi:hypothetical protein